MALTKIDDVYLYTAMDHTAQACFEMKQYLQDNNVNFNHLHYNDDSQLPDVFAPLSTWWEGETFNAMPILIYTEIHDDLPPSRYPRKFFKTLDDLKASTFIQDYQRGQN